MVPIFDNNGRMFFVLFMLKRPIFHADREFGGKLRLLEKMGRKFDLMKSRYTIIMNAEME